MLSLWHQKSPSFCYSPKRIRGSMLHALILFFFFLRRVQLTVVHTGIEPATLVLPAPHSNQLSYPATHASILNPLYQISEKRTQSQSLFPSCQSWRYFSAQLMAALFWVEHQLTSWNVHLTGLCTSTCLQFPMKCYAIWLFASHVLAPASSSLTFIWWISFWITEGSWEQNHSKHFCSPSCLA